MGSKRKRIHIIGGGLAGCEAAFQALGDEGIDVVLYEMRPHTLTEAHKSGALAELVCSNSFKSQKDSTASGLLKYELRAMNSLVIEAATHAQVPAGDALAVDRSRFSSYILEKLSSYPNFSLVHGLITDLNDFMALERSNNCVIIATGPLTEPQLAKALQEGLALGGESLFFYDAIAPIIDSESIDKERVFWANRYQDGPGGDYLNIPLDQKGYLEFVESVRGAPKVPLRDFEKVRYFESCLPIEVMAQRGDDTLRFGPMKPVGLVDPKTGKMPYANIQLRIENQTRTMLSMVGFQTKMTWAAQKSIFRMLPGLSDAQFLRFGSIHKNLYLNSPLLVNSDLSFKSHDNFFIAGQISGVEGYLESAAAGLLAARFALAKIWGGAFQPPPVESIMGGLLAHVTTSSSGLFQPMNANLGLLPPCKKVRKESRGERRLRQCLAAKARFEEYLRP